MNLKKETKTRIIIDTKSGLVILEKVVQEPSFWAIALGLIPALLWAAFKMWFSS